MGSAGSMVVPGREMHMNIMLETLKIQTDRQTERVALLIA